MAETPLVNHYGTVGPLLLQVLSSLYLGAPFSVLQHIAPDLGCFIGLRQLELKAHPLDTDDPDDDWDRDAVLTAALLRHLPPQLERLTASYFDLMQLAGEDEGEEESTAGGGGPPPPPLLPALTQLHVYNANEAVLDAPLPSLAALSFELGNGVSLVGDALQLPQLTYLGCANVIEGLQLRAGAMPALAYIQADCALAATDGYSALGSLTQLHLQYYPPGDHPGRDFDLLRGVASTLRSLWMEVERDTAGAYEIQAGEVAAAARLEQLTHLVGRCCCGCMGAALLVAWGLLLPWLHGDMWGPALSWQRQEGCLSCIRPGYLALPPKFLAAGFHHASSLLPSRSACPSSALPAMLRRSFRA